MCTVCGSYLNCYRMSKANFLHRVQLLGYILKRSQVLRMNIAFLFSRLFEAVLRWKLHQQCKWSAALLNALQEYSLLIKHT